MNNFIYISPQELIQKHPEMKKDLAKLIKIAKKKAKRCMNCDDLEWKYAGTGLCFTCTTGEWDASEDYELE